MPAAAVTAVAASTYARGPQRHRDDDVGSHGAAPTTVAPA